MSLNQRILKKTKIKRRVTLYAHTLKYTHLMAFLCALHTAHHHRTLHSNHTQSDAARPELHPDIHTVTQLIYNQPITLLCCYSASWEAAC